MEMAIDEAETIRANSEIDEVKLYLHSTLTSLAE